MNYIQAQIWLKNILLGTTLWVLHKWQKASEMDITMFIIKTLCCFYCCFTFWKASPPERIIAVLFHVTTSTQNVGELWQSEHVWVGGAVAVCGAGWGAVPIAHCVVEGSSKRSTGWISHAAWCGGACWSITARQCSHSMPNEGLSDGVEDKLFLCHQLILALLGDLSLMLSCSIL